MENLKSYESFSDVEIKESEGAKEYALSTECKMALESLCEELLCKEAEAYHEDANEEHTYEGYVIECMNYIKECMGQPGYAPLVTGA